MLRGAFMVKRILFWTAAGALLAIIAIQAVPYGRGDRNPPVRAEPQWDSARTRELVVRACFDCHSNEVLWPWYSNIAPVSWWMQNHVDEGRAALNYSEWDRTREGADSAESVTEGEMPPGYYYALGLRKRLTPGELEELISGLVNTFGTEGGKEGSDEEGESRRPLTPVPPIRTAGGR
jgi:hypothetical protein